MTPTCTWSGVQAGSSVQAGSPRLPSHHVGLVLRAQPRGHAGVQQHELGPLQPLHAQPQLQPRRLLQPQRAQRQQHDDSSSSLRIPRSSGASSTGRTQTSPAPDLTPSRSSARCACRTAAATGRPPRVSSRTRMLPGWRSAWIKLSTSIMCRQVRAPRQASAELCGAPEPLRRRRRSGWGVGGSGAGGWGRCGAAGKPAPDSQVPSSHTISARRQGGLTGRHTRR